MTKVTSQMFKKFRKKIVLNLAKFENSIFLADAPLESCCALLWFHVDFFNCVIFLRKLRKFLMRNAKDLSWRFLLHPLIDDELESFINFELLLFVPPDPDAPEGYPIGDAILQLMDHFDVPFYKIGGFGIGETEI